MTRYAGAPGDFPGHRIAARGPWKVKITIAPGGIGPGWMLPGRGFWREFGDGCGRILPADCGPIGGIGGHWAARREHRCAAAAARPVRLAGIKGRGPGLFNYFDRGNVRCRPARAIGSGNRATRSITTQRKGPPRGAGQSYWFKVGLHIKRVD